MKAGELDRRITLETYTTTKNSYGEEEKTWSTLATVWAKIDYSGGTEDFEADKNTAIGRVRFSIRHRTDVTEQTRILYESEYYDILAINEIGRREGLELITEVRK